MGFEKFEGTGSGRGRSRGTDPKISLRKSGGIGINRVALEEFFGEDRGAILYYDEAENRVGIEPVADADADGAAYTVSETTSGGGSITPQAFVRRYDLTPAVTTQYRPERDEDDGLVVVDLDDPVGTYGSADEEGESD